MAETEKKAKKPTALKRDLQNEKRRQRNTAFKSKVKTAIKTCKTAFEQKEEESSTKSKLNIVFSLMDKGVKKNIFKQNKAARVKSKMFALSQKAKS